MPPQGFSSLTFRVHRSNKMLVTYIKKAKMDFSTWQLRDCTVSARGAKSCALFKPPNEKVVLSLGSKASPMRTPFGATSFADEATARRTIEFSLSPEQHKMWQEFDEWAVQYLAKNSARLFKKKASVEEIRNSYKSPVSQKGDYRPMLRCKVNVSGATAVRCWNESDERCAVPEPEDLRSFDLVPRITISHLWLMTKEMGWVLQINDLMCVAQPQVSPFAEE